MYYVFLFFFFFFNDTATTEIYTLSLHDALPISQFTGWGAVVGRYPDGTPAIVEGKSGDGWVILSGRSEEHTSELQSQSNLVCRLLLEKKKKKKTTDFSHVRSSHTSTPYKSLSML